MPKKGITEDGINITTDSPPEKLPRFADPAFDENAPTSKMPNEDLNKEKPSEDTFQFRCAGPNKKCGHKDKMKYGGMIMARGSRLVKVKPTKLY